MVAAAQLYALATNGARASGAGMASAARKRAAHQIGEYSGRMIDEMVKSRAAAGSINQNVCVKFWRLFSLRRASGRRWARAHRLAHGASA